VFHGYKVPAKQGMHLEPVLTNSQLLSEYGFSEQEAADLRQKAGLPFFEVQGEFYYRREQVNHWLYKRFGKNNAFKTQSEDAAGPYVPELFTVADLARMFRVTLETVRHWHRTGRLPPAQRMGRRLLWPKKEVEAFAREKKAALKIKH
jgi:predicted DNA-binding transcriptional regulator AlpA